MVQPTAAAADVVPLLPALTLRQIQYFVTLAHAPSFTRAAERLSVTQPALTAAVRQVEFLLGGRLFERSPRRLELTAAGAAVLPLAERLLHTALGTFGDMRRVFDEGLHTVRVGFVPSAATWLLPRLQALQARLPKLRLELFDLTNTALVDALAGARVDVGVGVQDDEAVRRGLACQELFRDDLVLVARSDHALAQRRRAVAWRRLAGQPLAVFATGNVVETVHQTAASLGLSLEPSYRMQYTEPIYGLVRQRLALAVMPRLYTSDLRDDHLAVITLTSPRVRRTVALLSAGRDRSPMVTSCREALADRSRAGPG